jgi:hypothetical protein
MYQLRLQFKHEWVERTSQAEAVMGFIMILLFYN